MPDELAGLVDAARGGDRSAFEALVRATSADTYTLAFRLTGNDEDARDVVQETYLRVYKGIGKFRGDSAFSTWLYRITANCAANQLGKRKRHRHDELDDEAPYADASPDRDPLGQAELAQYRKLLKALRTLREEVLTPAPGLLTDILVSIEQAGERSAVRSALRGRRVAYVGAAAVAGVAGGAAAVVLVSRRKLRA